MSEFDRNLAVVIGINNYQNNIDRLQTAVPDAVAIAKILKLNYEYELVSPYYELGIILDRDATKENLEYLLNDYLPNKIKPTERDRLIFYFAGHGIARNSDNEPQGFLVPQNADMRQQNSLLRMSNVHDWLVKLECKHMLVILDCCFAGAFRWASYRKLIPIADEITKAHYDRFIRFPAWQVLTSASDSELALEFVNNRDRDNKGKKANNAQNHSPFAEGLIEALKNNKADLNDDGVIIATELYLFLQHYVAQNADEKQTPSFFPLRKHDRGEYLFKLSNFSRDNLEDAPPLDPERNPYRGLEPFEERHASLFFGRDEVVDELWEKVANLARVNNQLTVVTGISGSGKSSLVKAGLIPKLDNDVKQEWHILAEVKKYDAGKEIREIIRPGSNPYASLAGAIAQLTGKKFKNSSSEFITDIKAWSQTRPNARLLLAIDQFEELITLAPRVEKITYTVKKNWFQKLQDKLPFAKTKSELESEIPKAETEQWTEFIELLAEMLEKCPQLSLVVTLRSDFEPRFQNSVFSEVCADARFVVRPMRSDELREAVEKPAAEKALYFDPPELVDRLVDEVAQMPGALPLLSFTLSEMYIQLAKDWQDGRKEDRSLTVGRNFDSEGGVAGVLTRRANEEYEKLRLIPFISFLLLLQSKPYNLCTLLLIQHWLFLCQCNITMQRVMLRMVELERGEAVRRRVLASELDYPSDEENQRKKIVLDRLLKSRLIVTGTDIKANEEYYEPAHDFLVRGWDRLQEWIDEAQKENTLVLQRRLAPVATEYFKKQGSLWNADPRLNLLKTILNSNDNWFNQNEEKFVNKSITRKRLLDLVPWGIMIIAVIVSFVFNQLRINAEKQTIRALTQSSQAFLANKQQIDSLINAVVASRLVVKEKLEKTDIGILAISALRQAIYEQEVNSLQPYFREHNRLVQHTNGIRAVKFSPNSKINSEHKIIISSSIDHTVKVWKYNGALLHSFPHEYEAYSVAISPNNQFLVSGSGDSSGRVKVWKRNGGLFDLLHNWNYKSTIFRVNFHPDSQIIAFVDIQGNIKIRNVNGDLIKSWTEKGAKEVIFSPDEQHIAIVKRDSIQILNSDYELINTLEGQEVLVFSPDNQKIVALGSKNNIKIWNRNGKLLKKIPAHEENILSLSISPDSKIIASASVDRTIKLWSFDDRLLQTLEGHGDIVTHVNFSSDSQKIVSASNDRTIRIWKLVKSSNDSIFTLLRKSSPLFKFSPTFKNISFSPDGQKIAAISPDGRSIDTWFNREKIIQFVSKKRNQYIISINFISDNQIAWADTNSIKYNNNFDIEGTENIEIPDMDDFNVIDSNPNEDIFAAGKENGTIIILDQDKRIIKSLKKSHDQGITAITYSPDGNIIASGSYDDTIKLWTKDGELIETFVGHNSNVRDIAFSPDGNIIASASEDQTIRLWKQNGDLLKILQGHQNAVLSIDFSPDGETIASASLDGTIGLWRKDGQLLNILKSHKKGIWDISYSPNKNEKILVSYASDSSVRLWDLDFYKLIQWSCDWLHDYLISNPNISEQELDSCPQAKLHRQIKQ